MTTEQLADATSRTHECRSKRCRVCIDGYLPPGPEWAGSSVFGSMTTPFMAPGARANMTARLRCWGPTTGLPGSGRGLTPLRREGLCCRNSHSGKLRAKDHPTLANARGTLSAPSGEGIPRQRMLSLLSALI